MSPKQANPISFEDALRLCTEIRAENQIQWWRPSRWQCWGCVTFTGGDPAKMCFSSTPGNRGCMLVNTRYDRSAQ